MILEYSSFLFRVEILTCSVLKVFLLMQKKIDLKFQRCRHYKYNSTHGLEMASEWKSHFFANTDKACTFV